MTVRTPKAAFEFEGISIPLDKLLPTRSVGEKLKNSAKYRALLASVREVPAPILAPTHPWNDV